MRKLFDPGRLRHRVDINQKIDVQDSEGCIQSSFVAWAQDVPAEVVPVSGREFVAADATQSAVVARITIRYREGLLASMQIVHNGRIYNPLAVLRDGDSGMEFVSFPCSEGPTSG